MSERKVILYISMSVDGFLATKDDDLSWLSIVEKEGEDYGYGALTASVDTYIVGRKTYEVVLNLTNGVFSQADQYDCYVITREERKPENGITFYNGDMETLIHELKQKEGGNIYCDGGGQIVKLLMEKNLIDKYIISVIPVMLGDGKRLFLGGNDKIRLKAQLSKYFDTGLVQLIYEKA
jgi:dihydrofolate reductase